MRASDWSKLQVAHRWNNKEKLKGTIFWQPMRIILTIMWMYDLFVTFKIKPIEKQLRIIKAAFSTW